MKKYIIYTGSVDSGKTNALFKLCAAYPELDGVLQPVVQGYRCIYCIGDRSLLQLQTDQMSDNTVSIGRYIYLNDTFKKAQAYLDVVAQRSSGIIVIDEIGQLELQNGGLEPQVSKILHLSQSGDLQQPVLITIREKLLQAFYAKYPMVTGSDRVVIRETEDLQALLTEARQKGSDADEHEI